MNSIINLTKMVQEELDDKEAALADLKKIDIANQFLLGLVNDILDMSRIEQGKIILHLERYSYEEFLEYIRSTFQTMAKQKNICFTVERGMQNVDIIIDKIRFNQICTNLISNAIKYTPEYGSVSFKMVHGEIENGILPCDIYVADNGIGMSENFQKKMFGPFEQEGRAYKAVEGTGLGLSIVKEMVDILHGTIDVRSEIDKGTEFHVHLDMTVLEKESGSTGEKQTDYTILKGKQILIVEDHSLNQEIARRLLEKVGMVVKVADNGLEGLRAFEKDMEAYDGILMDMRMPVMDGMEATKRIRELKSPKAQTVPIIAMTANAMDEEVHVAMAQGMNAYLAKPIDAKLLYQTLVQVLHN